ncbi:hypothetical protein [Achromobacter piechaudii]|uniref:Uncharacterized protein n=1 Tax=Achromobacter piechaudii TaxID=72556 RepID=A0A6S7DHF0_9BURK|nr:hypothetical protein [Achromobacter piechaudii]CAB3878296.1 hypothetical protein LMG1861_03136 [Achromobacter piechaudii]
MVDVKNVRIYLGGHVDDLYALSLLFPKKAIPDLYIVTDIFGRKDGQGDRVSSTDSLTTYLTGEGCLPVVERNNATPQEIEWIALEIIGPLNGYAALADSNFRSVLPISVSWEGNGGGGCVTFGSSVQNKPQRSVATNRHPLLWELLPTRVEYMRTNSLASSAANVIAGPPSWAEYYRLLEDIAGHFDSSLDKLSKLGLAEREGLDGFKNAANNREHGRHGTSKRNLSISQESLMNLREAREFVRGVVSNWLDRECGGRLPRDRVDGAPLRFGLDGAQV